MDEKTKQAIEIDLSQFKLHIHLKHKTELTLHFDSPSRMFYLTVIALVVNEMKRLGKITSIPMEDHSALLALLNETIGGSAGSSDKERLIPRIYRKWKDALPDLENGPLFKVIGRKKELEDGVGKTYHFTEAEKDSWANLFEYIGSEEHVRLRFSIDRIGASLDDVVIVYEDSSNGDAWNRFLSNLKRKEKNLPEAEAIQSPSEVPVLPISPEEKQKATWQDRCRWTALVAIIVLIVGVATLAIWKLSFKSASVEKASVERMAFQLPDKPSIAVLPFINMSGDPKEDYFSDGLTEQIITNLSTFHKLFVIARNSTFVYKGKPVKIQKVAEDLGVRYVLEGSVQKSGDKVRITAQLVDAITGRHVWSEHYDREFKDIFALQDEITIKIMRAMRIKLTDGEQARHWTKGGTKNLKAYVLNYQGCGFIGRGTKQDNDTARHLFEEAIALDPKYACAYINLGTTYFWDARNGWSESPAKSIQRALELAQKALAMDDSLDLGHSLLGAIYLVMRQHDKAIAEGERAVALNPNGALAFIWLAGIVGVSGKWEESVMYAKQSIRLSPFPGPLQYDVLGRAYFMTGKYDEAIFILKKALQMNLDFLPAHIFLAACYSSIGRDVEAKASAIEVLRINPKFSIESYAKRLTYKNKADIEREVAALQKAGLK
jgi:adenylate cyclase